MSKSKNRRAVDQGYEKLKQHDPADAVGLVRNLSFAKFDESVDAVFELGIDPRQADQIVRGTVSLPTTWPAMAATSGCVWPAPRNRRRWIHWMASNGLNPWPTAASR